MDLDIAELPDLIGRDSSDSDESHVEEHNLNRANLSYLDWRRAPTMSTVTKCSLQHAHECLMHAHDARVRATCKKLCIKASDNCKDCEDCAVTGQKQIGFM